MRTESGFGIWNEILFQVSISRILTVSKSQFDKIIKTQRIILAYEYKLLYFLVLGFAIFGLLFDVEPPFAFFKAGFVFNFVVDDVFEIPGFESIP